MPLVFIERIVARFPGITYNSRPKRHAAYIGTGHPYGWAYSLLCGSAKRNRMSALSSGEMYQWSRKPRRLIP